MEVTNNIYSPTTTAAYSSASAETKAAEAKAAEAKQEQKADEAYIYEKSSETEKANYKPDAEKVKKMIAEANSKTEGLRSLVEKLLQKQGKTAQQALGQLQAGEQFLIPVDEATRAKAQEDISEDGYYGVKQTSERILDFAKAISGGDPSKIAELKSAVEEGFKQAEKMWGGELPEISKQTYDAVMKGFDEWEKSSKN